jgi:transcriptional regulator with PAS, ATPase and Fis domain
LGETGTGKELLARALHSDSKRTGPFVAVNCGALPSALVESLLFGHVRGSFSGAVRDEVGLIRSAEKGTLFLDEIGDFPLPAQASLLRVLQEREVLPVGGTRAARVDLRVVCATHRELDACVTAGSFRADLLARLDGFRRTIPPLRDRREDLGLLVATLLSKLVPGNENAVSFEPSAARALASYDWPGNVRELEQTLSRALALHPDGCIGRLALGLNPRLASPHQENRDRVFNEQETQLRARLRDELGRYQGNVSQVARAMGKARTQVQRWIRRFGLDPEAYRHVD